MTDKTGVTRIKIRRGLRIVKRGNIWYAETCLHGRQERRSLDTSDPEEAKSRALSQSIPQAPKPAPPVKLSLANAYDEYETWYARNRKVTGGKRALPVVWLFVQFSGTETDVSQVTRDQVQRFVDERRDGGKWTKRGKGAASITVRTDFAKVRAFLRWIDAKKPGLLQNGITRGIDLPKDDGVTASALSVKTVKGVIRELKRNSRIEWLSDWWAVLCETGMRPSELLGVRAIDLKGKLLSIEPWGTEYRRDEATERMNWTGAGRTLKSKWSRRKIELSSLALSILSERVEKMFDKSRPIFGTSEGTVYQERSVYHYMVGALKETSYKGATPYGARHFFCSEHAAPGPQHMEVEALAAYIGHSPKSREVLLRWYTDQDALRRGAPVSLIGDEKEGKVAAMGKEKG